MKFRLEKGLPFVSVTLQWQGRSLVLSNVLDLLRPLKSTFYG